MALDAAPPGLDAVRDTLNRVAPHINRTPVHRWRGTEIDARVGAETEVLLKLELFQQTGTFKARGALNNILSLDAEARARGVTAVSAGNHAVAVAFAAQKAGTSAKVVMMSTANPARVARAKAYGAEVLMAGTGAEAFELARKIEAEEGRVFIHPFEGPGVAAGTGSVALEWHDQAGPMDAVIIPVGGGGLIAGMSAVFKALNPDCKIYGVEPVGADSMTRSFAAGEPVQAAPMTSIADSLGPPYSLPYSYGLTRENVDEIVLIEDDQMIEAMALLFREMKLAVEPAGAAATAALLGPLNERLRGKRVGVLICGANIDIERFAEFVAKGNAMAGRV